MKYINAHIINNRKSFNKIWLVLILSSFNILCDAQQFNNWIFHENNGLTFNTNPPSFLAGGQIGTFFPYTSSYSTSTISDRNGNLLFYSDGEKVWNKNNQIMPNGTGLLGDLGQINTALIIPFINDTSRYYLFISKGLSNLVPNAQSSFFYSYNVVDMSLNGGLGDITIKNVLIKNFANEKMVAIPNANGNDIWWICRDWTNNFFSYKINCSGFQNNNPVVSTTGANINNDASLLSAGDIKASPNGKLIAACYYDYFEIYNFNSSTGILTNPIKIPVDNCYGLEFSPNSKVLYITQIFNDPDFPRAQIAQYNLNNYDSATIINSTIRISQPVIPDGYSLVGGLQLGPDNKIYHARFDETLIDVINSPNSIGGASNFQAGAIILPNVAFRRLPYSYVNLITNQNTQISYTVGPDCRTVTLQGKTSIKGSNLTFKWSFGNPLTAGTPADSLTQVISSMGDTTFATTTYTYPLGTDTFNVSLTVTSDTVCGIGRAGKKVIVKPPPPIANFGFSNTCSNLTVAFSDSTLLNTNPTVTYIYAYKPALAPLTSYTNFAITASPSFTFATYDSFDIRLIVTSSLSCVQKDTIVKRIGLKAKPVDGFAYISACGSFLVNINNTATIAAGTINSYKYYLGNTLLNINPNFSYLFPSYGSYTIKQIVQSSQGCISDTFTLSVLVRDTVSIFLSFANDSVCANTNFVLTSNASVNAASIVNYNWKINNGATITNTTNTLIQNLATGTYNYKHWVSSSQGCPSDTIYQTIKAVSKPTASITAASVCGSRLVNFVTTNTVTNDVLNYYFINYGNANTLVNNMAPTSYTYPNYGSYNISYIVKSSIGCASDSTFASVIVKDKPAVILSFANDSVCANTNFTLTSNVTVAAANITNYYWQINNGAVSTSATNAQINNFAAGIYNFKHWVKTNQGCESDTVFQTITVVSKPTASITATAVCGSRLVNFATTNTVTNDVLNYYFINYGNATTLVNNTAPTSYTYPNYGGYNISYIVKSSIGCASDSAFAILVVKDKPTLPNIAYNNNACAGTNFTLTSNSTVADATISTYFWQINNGAILNNASNAQINNLPAGNYNFKHWVVSSKGCESDTAFKTVVVDVIPQANFTVQNTCVNKNVVFVNNSTGNIDLHTWTITPTDIRTGTTPAYSPTYAYTGAGNFSVNLKTQSSNGCATNISKQINIETNPVANFNIVEACLGKPIIVQNNSSNVSGAITNYTWQSAAQNSNAILPNFIYNTVGDYAINLNIATANNCTASTSKNVSIRAVQLFITNDTSIAINQPLQLNISGALNYTWLPTSNLNNATIPNPIFTTNQAGIYLLTAEGTTAQGCKGMADVAIKVFKTSTYLLLPNAFTPNGDGLNDYFKPTCAGLKELTSFTIYNRYGQAIFNQKGCGSTRGWDGKFGGTAQNPSAFVYVWTGVDFNGKVVSDKGMVMLIR